MSPDQTPARILIAEDEFLVALQLKEQIESLGHAVARVVGSGEEAVEAALKDRPDLVLMDILLAGRMDGVEAAERIRQALGVPIIFISALAEQERLVRASLTQPCGYLLKPFDERQLRVALAMALHVSAAEGGRRRAEAALKESEETFRLFFDQAPMPYQSLDKDGRFLAVNDAWLNTLGYAREEVLGRAFVDFIHPDWRERFHANFPRFKALGEIQGVEFEMVRKDGALIRVAFNGKIGRDEAGGFLRTHCVFQDITARRQAERSLRESEEKYRLLTETLEEIVFLVDLEGRIAFVNRFGANSLGHEPEELLGRDVFDLVAPESLPEALERRALRRAGRWSKLRYETVFLTQDGRRLPVEAQSSPFHRDDRVTGFLILARNMTERQQAEREVREARDKLAGSLEALRQSEERFRLLAETSSDAILLRDEEGLIVYVNPAAVQLLHAQGPEELVGRLYLDLVHPDDQAGSRERIRFSLERDGVAPLREHRLLALDGRVIPVESTGAPFTFRGRRYIQGVFRDITARKKAELALQASERRFRSLVENMVEGVAQHRLVLDGTGTPIDYEILDVNLQGAALLGLAREALVNRLATAAYGLPEPPYLAEYAAVVRTGRPLRFETFFEPRGRYYDISVAPLGEGGFATIFSDITERKRAEEELKRSEENFKVMVEHAPDAIFVQTEGCFAYLNPMAVKLFGAVSPEQVLGGPVFDRLHPDYHEAIKERIRQLNVERKTVPPLEEKFLRLDGVAFDVEATAVPITYQGRQGGLVFFRDVSGRREAEAEKKKLEAQLRQSQKMQAIGTLAGGIAHDFNNILAVIIGHADLGLLDLPERHPGRLSFDNILKAGQRAKAMVKQILDFSRPVEENRRPLQVEAIIKETMKLLRPSLPTTIEIRTKAAAVGPVLADPSQIHQMLMNLCANAAHAMREKGGVLEVGLQEVALDTRTATKYADLRPGRYVRLSVSDTGHGMDHQTLERIFEPFFTTKRPGEGTGMGLAVVHSIVRNHHGQINVYSEPGQGSVFNVYLPLLEETEAEAGGPEAGAIPQGRERILFVDDEEMLVGLGQALLSRLGYQVTALTSSLKALELIRSNPQAFDLLVTDQTMPFLTGLQLAQQVLRLRPDLPVILCSGFSETVNAETALAAGVKAFAMKPLSLRDIAATIRQVLDQAPSPAGG